MVTLPLGISRTVSFRARSTPELPPLQPLQQYWLPHWLQLLWSSVLPPYSPGAPCVIWKASRWTWIGCDHPKPPPRFHCSRLFCLTLKRTVPQSKYFPLIVHWPSRAWAKLNDLDTSGEALTLGSA